MSDNTEPVAHVAEHVEKVSEVEVPKKDSLLVSIEDKFVALVALLAEHGIHFKG